MVEMRQQLLFSNNFNYDDTTGTILYDCIVLFRLKPCTAVSAQFVTTIRNDGSSSSTTNKILWNKIKYHKQIFCLIHICNASDSATVIGYTMIIIYNVYVHTIFYTHETAIMCTPNSKTKIAENTDKAISTTKQLKRTKKTPVSI